MPSLDRRMTQEADWLPLPLDPGSSFAFRHVHTRHFPFPFHYHPETEICLIVKGHGRRVVGETVYAFGEGEVVVLGSMLPHVWISDALCTETEAYILRFDESILEGKLLQLVECAGVAKWLSRAKRGLVCRVASVEEMRDGFASIRDAKSPGRRLVRFLDLVLTLSQTCSWKEICKDRQEGVVGGCSEQRIGFALRYVRRHFCAEISQAEIARRVGMKAAAFSRLFARVAGQTFQEMLLQLRLEHACRLLQGSSLPVVEVAFASGFQNLSNFNKQFRQEYRMPPREYRSKNLL